VESSIAPFIAASAARGTRPPLCLQGADSRGWQVGSRGGDALVLDEFGDLWWAKLVAGNSARVIRECWPEEAISQSTSIKRALASIA
jgi:hypothetical protein